LKNKGHAHCLSYLFYFDEVEPLFADDNLDSVEKTLISEVTAIEDYTVLE